MGVRDKLDRFYTPHRTVEKCLSALSINKYELIIEPSAGGGAFSSKLPFEKTIALDICPSAPGIEKRDFLSFEPASDDLGTNKKVLVVGNPPFGTRSTLAKKFIAHAISIGADTIAFVLPNTFTKYTNQRVFPADWRLVSIVPLTREECTFELACTEEASIGNNMGEAASNTKESQPISQDIYILCSFFVWTRCDDVESGKDLRDVLVPQPDEFSYLGRGDESADFSVNGNNGRTKDIEDITNPKAEHYIKVSPEYDEKEIRSMLDSIEYDFRSSVNGGVAWLSQNDINKAFLACREIPL